MGSALVKCCNQDYVINWSAEDTHKANLETNNTKAKQTLANKATPKRQASAKAACVA